MIENMKLHRLLIIVPFLLTSCNKEFRLKRPDDTNLSFWITQEITDEDIYEKGCTLIPGWFGASEYLDGKYTLNENEEGDRLPDTYVTYLVSGYPDVLSKSSAVVKINITDPEITVYGLTINSSKEEIENRMKSVSGASGKERTYSIGKASFYFSEECINISVPVTNKQHVLF